MSTSLKAVFGMDATAFRAELKQTMAEARSAVNSFGNIVMAAGVAAVGALSKGAIDLAGRLTDVAANLTINIESLQALEALHKKNGVSAEAFNNSLAKVKNNVVEAAQGNKANAAALATLGLSAEKLLKLPLERQYEAIAIATARSKDQAAAYNAVSTLFGEKVGPKLMGSLHELAQRGFPEVMKSAQEAGDIMDNNTAQALDRAGDAIENFKRRATIAVGNILVNFRTEEGVSLLWMQLERAVVSFGLGIIDAIVEAGGMAWRVFSGTFVGVANKFRDALLSNIIFAAEQVNKILPKRFEIDVGKIEALKSAGKSVGDTITEAIARTEPSQLKKTYQEVQDRLIAEQKKLVKEEADAIQKAHETGGQSGARSLALGGKTAGDAIAATAAPAILAAAKEAAAEIAQAFSGGIGRKGKAPETLSDNQLAALEQNIRNNLNQTRAADAQIYGVGLTSYKSPQQYLLEQELARVQRERDLRASFSRDLGFFGAGFVEREYSPTDFERLRNLAGLTTAAEQTNQKLDRLNETLRERIPHGAFDAELAAIQGLAAETRTVAERTALLAARGGGRG